MGIRIIACALLLASYSCRSAVSPPPLTGVYKSVAVDGHTFEYRYVSCAPHLSVTARTAKLENVEVTGVSVLNVDMQTEDERRFFAALVLFNNWMEQSCQTITQLGSSPELVLQYSKTRDEIVVAFLRDYLLRQQKGQTASLDYSRLAERIWAAAGKTDRALRDADPRLAYEPPPPRPVG